MDALTHKALIALTLAATAAAATIAALVAEWRLERLDRAQLVDAAQWVSLPGGTKIRVVRAGDEHGGGGRPTVVLLNGLTGTVESWRFVQREVARFAPVFAYDRAGTGFSDEVGGERDAAAVAAELEQVLAAANVSPPYVLVAHSIAGLYARVYAARHPGGVAALVLVDPLTEDEWSRVSPDSSGADKDYMFHRVPRQAGLAYLGLLRLKAWLKGPARVDPRLEAASYRGAHWRTAGREAAGVYRSFEQARAAGFPPGVLVGVLSAGMPRTGDIAIVQALHRELVSASGPGGVYAVDPDADHSELLELPEHSLRVSAFIRQVLPSLAGR